MRHFPPVSCARQARLSELSSENRRLRQKEEKEKEEKRNPAGKSQLDDVQVDAFSSSSWGISNGSSGGGEGRERLFEDQTLCGKSLSLPRCGRPQEGECEGMLLRFLQGIQPVSHVYWDN